MKATKSLRLVAALALAFVPLFFASPAKANPLVNGDTIQFTYYWSAHERTFTDANVSIVVTNNITNKIGGNGEVIDTYRITVGNQVIERTEKHDALTYSFQIVGTQTIKLEGIDRGFWGGYYGPIMQILVESTPTPSGSPQVETHSPSVTTSPTTSSESESPTESATASAPTESPSTDSTPILWDYVVNEGWATEVTAPEGSVFSRVVARYIAFDSDCGIDVSEQVGAILLGTSSGVIESNNGVFGDPCPGWYKKLVVSVEYSQVQIIAPVQPQPESQPPVSIPEPAPSPEPQPEPSPEPAPVEPTESPSVEPQPETTPTPEPSPEPQQTEEPVEPEPTTKPTPSPEEEVPTVSQTLEPSPEPEPSPESESTTPEIAIDAPIEELVEAIADIKPSELTSAQIEILSEAALETFATAEQGSEEYQQALEILAVIAEADDQELPAELAAIPFVGDVAGAVLEVFNDIGNIGADMAPEQRERAEETVVAAVIVGQVAQVASAAAASASMAASRK